MLAKKCPSFELAPFKGGVNGGDGDAILGRDGSGPEVTAHERRRFEDPIDNDFVESDAVGEGKDNFFVGEPEMIEEEEEE